MRFVAPLAAFVTLISYSVNTFDYVDLITHADLYRPRFVRARMVEP
jgi:hypothetical protein